MRQRKDGVRRLGSGDAVRPQPEPPPGKPGARQSADRQGHGNRRGRGFFDGFGFGGFGEVGCFCGSGGFGGGCRRLGRFRGFRGRFDGFSGRISGGLGGFRRRLRGQDARRQHKRAACGDAARRFIGEGIVAARDRRAALQQAVADGTLTEERVNESVYRILLLKCRFGIVTE